MPLLILPIAGGVFLMQGESSEPRFRGDLTSSRLSIGLNQANPIEVNGQDVDVDSVLSRGINWLVEAQHTSGAWGAGSHSRQNVRDPHAVKVDPATTSLAAMALLRAEGLNGKHREHLQKATEYILSTIEASDDNGPLITDVKGSQPQRKLGAWVDTSMAIQFLSRYKMRLAADAEIGPRVQAALDKAVEKLEKSQSQDGSWSASGWAGVLQSASGYTALEDAAKAGAKVNEKNLRSARKYQRENFNKETGKSRTDKAAGIEFYSLSSSQRAVAAPAKKAKDVFEEAIREGKLDEDEELNAENLQKLGLAESEAETLADAVETSRAQARRINDENVLRGFGNNGGEEFISYLQSTEAMAITGGKEYKEWNRKVAIRLGKIQNGEGYWSGHHCITSPVFCTAAVLLTLTVDNDLDMLMEKAESKDKGQG